MACFEQKTLALYVFKPVFYVFALYWFYLTLTKMAEMLTTESLVLNKYILTQLLTHEVFAVYLPFLSWCFEPPTHPSQQGILSNWAIVFPCWVVGFAGISLSLAWLKDVKIWLKIQPSLGSELVPWKKYTLQGCVLEELHNCALMELWFFFVLQGQSVAGWRLELLAPGNDSLALQWCEPTALHHLYVCLFASLKS